MTGGEIYKIQKKSVEKFSVFDMSHLSGAIFIR